MPLSRMVLRYSVRVPQQKNAPAGCSKRLFSKAAGESKPEALHFSPAHPKLPRQLVIHAGYVEDFDETRTMPGKRRVSAGLGWAGEKAVFQYPARKRL